MLILTSVLHNYKRSKNFELLRILKDWNHLNFGSLLVPKLIYEKFRELKNNSQIMSI